MMLKTKLLIGSALAVLLMTTTAMADGLSDVRAALKETLPGTEITSLRQDRTSEGPVEPS